jgi:hypothetical protein
VPVMPLSIVSSAAYVQPAPQLSLEPTFVRPAVLPTDKMVRRACAPRCARARSHRSRAALPRGALGRHPAAAGYLRGLVFPPALAVPRKPRERGRAPAPTSLPRPADAPRRPSRAAPPQAAALTAAKAKMASAFAPRPAAVAAPVFVQQAAVPMAPIYASGQALPAAQPYLFVPVRGRLRAVVGWARGWFAAQAAEPNPMDWV